jgi:integrase
VDRRGQLGSLGASRHGPDARLSADAIRDIVVRRARHAGLSPAHGQRFFTAHSTRSGFATQAAANGASERAIMDQGRWRSLQVARGYIRRGSVFTDNAAGRLGL